MPLQPRRVKFRKFQRGKNRGIAIRGSNLNFGEYGLKALANGIVENIHIEAIRVLFARQLRGTGRVYIRIFPHKSVTKKPSEVRMGKGKGDLSCWVAPVRRGAILFELGGVPEALARQAMRLAAFKLPFRVKFVSRSAQG